MIETADSKGCGNAFRHWFAGSQVVDHLGQPLVVYHGTCNVFERFVARSYAERVGFYFTTSPEFASEFAESSADDFAYEKEDVAQGPLIIPAYLSIRRPLDVRKGWPSGFGLDRYSNPDDFWLPLDGANGSSLMRELKRGGYDGLRATELGCEVWVAFRSEQIKSSIGNSGAFDPTNPDICDSFPAPAARLAENQQQRQPGADEGFAP